MTNFEYYRTLDGALGEYAKIEHVYNVDSSVSAGRFLEWLYKDNDTTGDKTDVNLEIARIEKSLGVMDDLIAEILKEKKVLMDTVRSLTDKNSKLIERNAELEKAIEKNNLGSQMWGIVPCAACLKKIEKNNF